MITRDTLVHTIADQAGITQKQSAAALDALIRAMIEAAMLGEDIAFKGFGRFRVKQEAAKIGRNPRTGETSEIPPRRVLRFKASTKMREALNP